MYLNIIQLAESLGVSERVIEDWIGSEGLPCIRDGSRLSFDRAQIVAWAAGRGLAAKAGFLAANAQPSGHKSLLAGFLAVGGIWRDVPASDALHVMARAVARLSGVSPEVIRVLAQRVHVPNAMNWAAVGEGMAMPHLRVPVALGRDVGVLAILQLRDPAPLPQPAPDGVPVKSLFFFVAPSARVHLEMVSELSAHLLHGRLKALLADNAPDDVLFAALAEPPPRPGKRSASS